MVCSLKFLGEILLNFQTIINLRKIYLYLSNFTIDFNNLYITNCNNTVIINLTEELLLVKWEYYYPSKKLYILFIIQNLLGYPSYIRAELLS